MNKGDSFQDGRYAPPRAHVEDVNLASEWPVLAGRASRLWAVLLDTGILMGSFWLASVLTPWNPWGNEEQSLTELQLLNMVVGFLIFVAVNGFLLARRGQTVGKAALGIRIARADGSAASFGRLIGLRYGVGYLFNAIAAVGMIFSLVDALMIFRSSRRCLHDVIADTVVLKA